MRLIDADALKADYGMKDDCADCDKELRGKSKACEFDRVYTKMDFCGWLDDAPTVDAVPVVRCKDCRFHGYNTYTKVHYCRRPNVVLVIKENDFCKYGEQKDGKGNGNEID